MEVIKKDLPSPIFFNFVLNKPSGYKVIREHETIHYKKEINLFWLH